MKPVHFYSCLSKALVAGLILTGALSTKVLAEEADPKWKEPYDTPVTITTVRGTGAVAFHFDPGASISDNLWTRSFQNVLNVTVKTDWVSSDYDIKLNLAMAAGKLPDVFVVNTEQLKRLEMYDNANGSFLIDTLLNYYMCGFNVQKTAQMMYVHRNSLQYRLKKIEEILEISLDDSMEYLDVVNCILVKRLMFN